ncbi:hypothetical protein BU26DRAFT_516777 [Trematosphaeria pertusa]|uniref:Uncharacterized protein n=1 Tax=Trematosphaeria pertusa TaxID=390896 RepID=A0A6A6IPT0_9PLEO|nr:uncharacterized protein BU26DRAFT_516777 [Trematosphaeria pertusa]KAF2252078.1 hypothetical protein BU26DRAFT_516777 [Trematosphaeria pertusa]
MAPQPLSITSDLSGLSPMAVHDLHLAKRAEYKVNPGKGAKPANEINNLGFQVLFALIGVGMVLTALWFFFWAKNGGFKWRKNDWEDYKSTVLRRKGPDGKTLSNATKSTKLGGGSVVHGGSYGAATSVGYTDETGTTADFSEMREVEEGKSRRHFGLRGGDEKKKKKKHQSREHTNNYKDPELREYREERPARVGGINRQADGMYTDYSATEPSELGSNVSGRPLVKDKDKEKNPKDKKKEAKEKERRAKERMRKAQLAEKEAAKNAAAEAKAQKAAEKAKAKKEKEEQKKEKKTKKPRCTETEATPSEAPAMTEVTAPSEAPGPARRGPPSGAYSFTTGDDQTVYTGIYTENRTAPSEGIPESSYYSDYRPNADPGASSRSRSAHNRESRTRSRPSSQSPRKHHRTSRQPAPSDIFTQANGDVQGTIAYPCHIPGLSSAGSVGVSESVSQVGGPSSARRQRDVMDGYRRGGVRAVGRRDSLSDSDA